VPLQDHPAGGGRLTALPIGALPPEDYPLQRTDALNNDAEGPPAECDRSCWSLRRRLPRRSGADYTLSFSVSGGGVSTCVRSSR
jgi:hypothetical protein